MPVQNFFIWNSKLFPKRVGLLLNTSQNFRGIFLEPSFFKTARSTVVENPKKLAKSKKKKCLIWIALFKSLVK